MYQHYSAPGGFCFDANCGDDPIVNNTNFTTYNAVKKANQFYDYLNHMSQHYISDHLFVPMGDDFNYQNAKMNYESMDALISTFNSIYDNFTLIYSTPSNYVDALAAENIKWTVKKDDMFPYADDDNNFWSGYFTSRANDKEYTRRASYNY